MSANPQFAPIIRRVQFGGVMFDNVRHTREELKELEGQDVLLDMEIDVRTEARSFRVYDMWQNEICVIDLGHVDTIGDVIS
jgi:hypothetical protein